MQVKTIAHHGFESRRGLKISKKVEEELQAETENKASPRPRFKNPDPTKVLDFKKRLR